jgi:hypothetical protein
VTTNNHEPPTHLVFRLLRCDAATATSSCSSTCICDWESRSPEPSSLAILCRERANKFFWKAIFAAAHLLLQVVHHGSSTSLSDNARRGSLSSTRAPSGWSSTSSDHHHKGTASHIRFLLSNDVLPIGYVDLHRYGFARYSIIMFTVYYLIDLSRIYDSTGIH